jgi:hypothetical protein
MQRQKFNIRLLSALIILFAAMHLFLNLYIMILPFILTSDELQKVMHILSQTFGPIAIREDRNFIILCVKVTASALFLSSGIGVIKFKEWSRKLLFCLLGLRILYGFTICIISNIFHPHLAIILTEGLFLFYYLTRPKVKQQFMKRNPNLPKSGQGELANEVSRRRAV